MIPGIVAGSLSAPAAPPDGVPEGHVGEIAIMLPTPLPLMPLEYPYNRSNVWIGDLQTVTGAPPEPSYTFDVDFDTRDAAAWAVLTKADYGEGGPDADDPVFAYRYDAGSNAIALRTWQPWAYDAFGSDFLFWLDLYGLASEAGESLLSSATQSNGDAPVGLTPDPYGGSSPFDYSDSGFEIVEQYMEFMLRKV